MNTATIERPAQQESIIAQKNADVQGKLQTSLEGLQHVMHISMATYVASLTSSIMSYKHATLTEAATGLAIMCERNAADRHAKRMLVSVYAAAGYSCSESTDGEYKSVMRKVSIISELFNFIGAEKVQEWVGGNSEGAAITAIVKGLEPLGIKSMDGILALVGKPRIQRAASAPQAPASLPAAPQQPIVSGTEKEPDKTPAAVAEGAQVPLEEGEIVLEKPVAAGATEAEEEETPRYMRRASDIADKAAASVAANHTSVNPYEGWTTVGTEHVVVVIAKEATRLEVLEAAMQLVSIAEQMEHKAIEEKAARETVMAAKLKEELKKVAVGKSIKVDEVGGLQAMKPKGRRVVR